jgi:hypothetical protein
VAGQVERESHVDSFFNIEGVVHHEFLCERQTMNCWPLNDAWPLVLGLMYVELLMLVLTSADGFCCLWFIYPVWF